MSTLSAGSSTQQGALAAVPNAPASGSSGTSRAGYNTMHAAPQFDPGATFGTPQSGPWAQHAPYQQGFGVPYAPTPGTNPQLPPVASFDPAWRQNCGYGGQFASPPNTSQQLPPVASLDPAWNQGHAYDGSHAMTPGMEPGPLSYQAEDSGSHDQFVPRSDIDCFSEKQQKWIFKQGPFLFPGRGWKEIAREYQEEFGGELPYFHSLKAAYDKMCKANQ